MQDSTDKILNYEQRLKSILDNCNNIVVAIYGDFGVGKTHFWKAFCDKLDKDKNIYISLIGKSDIVAIRESLALNLAKKSGLICKFKNIRFALNLGVVSFNSSVSNLLDLISKENFNNQIICFDDMERMDSAILPNTESIFQIAKDGVNLAHNAENIIRDYCTQKGITNIRVTRRIFDDFTRFEKEINCDLNAIKPQILDILVRFSAINAMKMGVDLMRLHLFYIYKFMEVEHNEKIDNEVFSNDEIRFLTPFFFYMENISLSVKLGEIVPIIAKFINAESLSNNEKAEIVKFKM